MKNIYKIAVITLLISSVYSLSRADTREEYPDISGNWDRIVLKRFPLQFDPSVYDADKQTPPLKPEYMKIWKDRLLAAAKGELSYDTSVTKCFPKGMPRVMMAAYGMEIVQSAREITLFNEASQENVRIYLDGRHPRKDYTPTFIGFTEGKWTGPVLNTKTVGIRTDGIFDGSGIPHSDELTITQSFRLLDADTLEDILISKDPKAFERDWVVRMVFRRAPRDRYADELICQENNRDIKTAANPTK